MSSQIKCNKLVAQSHLRTYPISICDVDISSFAN